MSKNQKRKAHRALESVNARALLDGVVDRTSGEILAEGLLRRKRMSETFANPIAKIYDKFVTNDENANQWRVKAVRSWVYGFLDICIGIRLRCIREHHHWRNSNTTIAYAVSKTEFRRVHGNIDFHQDLWQYAESIGLCKWIWTGSNLKEHMGVSAIDINFRFLNAFYQVLNEITSAAKVAAIRNMVTEDDLEPYSDEDIMALNLKFGDRLRSYTLSPVASESIMKRTTELISELFSVSDRERNGLIGLLRSRDENDQLVTFYKQGRCRMSSAAVKPGDMGFTSMRKSIRAKVLRDFVEYDIQAAAPCIMYFKAIECMKKEDIEKNLPLLSEFVKNPAEFRTWFEKQTGVPAKELKNLLNRALFARNLNVRSRYHKEIYMLECRLTGRGHRYNKTASGVKSASPIHAILNELYYARNRLIRRARRQQDTEMDGLIKRYRTEFGLKTDVEAVEKAAHGQAKWYGYEKTDANYESVYNRCLREIIIARLNAKRPRYSFKIENDMGVVRDLERWKKSSALAHMIFGAETAVMNKVRDFIRATTGEELIHIHDAFYIHESANFSISDLEDYIEKETGMRLRFSKKS